MTRTAATLALLTTALVQPLISPPLGWLPLHFAVWVPAFLVFDRLEGRRALLAGWFVGTVANLAIFHWLAGTVARFGGLPTAAGVAVLLLYAAATGFYTAIVAWGFGPAKRMGGTYWPFTVAVWFCAVEFLHPQIFPYLQGVAWYQVPSLFLVSSFAGVSAVSFLMIALNGAVTQAVEAATGRAQRSDAVRSAAIVALAFAGAIAVGTYRSAEIAGIEAATDPVRIAVIQPDHSDERRAELRAEGLEAFARDLVELSEQAVAEHPGVAAVVWPEGGLRSAPDDPRNAEVIAFAIRHGIEVWTGANHHDWLPDGETVSHNAAFRVRTDGSVDTRYDKHLLVPFGEYVPGRDVIPGFDRIPTFANFERGTERPVYTFGDVRFAFLICYEAIKTRFVSETASPEVNLLVNVTVDHWYGDTSEQSQHLMLAAIQSALLGIPLVRSTTTGISAATDARGVFLARTDTFTREYAVVDLRPTRAASVFSSLGNWFAWLCVGASAIGLLLRTARRTRGGESG